MADAAYRDTFPKAALLGAGGMLLATLLFVAAMRITGTEPTAEVPVASKPLASRQLKFEDRANGDVVVFDVSHGAGKREIAVLPPGTNGFLRAVMRGLAQARTIAGIGRQIPFTLTELADGRLVLADPTTGRRIYLRAFGPTNSAAFGRLLTDAPIAGADAAAARADHRG